MKKILLLLICLQGLAAVAQPFVHPGINQTAGDLALMKKKVLAGEQPWKDAFTRLKAAADTTYNVKAHTHVLRGPFGRPNIGGDDLSKSASRAYDLALVWYITNDKAYAQKAIEILNAWSPVLWDFDYNDAKLLAAWTGHALCNAAEILRYTNAGWKKEDIEQFTTMLKTAYYPLIRFYFPQANGNWDGAIIHSILAIGIFTDNREMFNNGIDHYLHGPVNGSLFKYIYPSGQCQETLRDQGHVQLGLGEFAGAAQVAFTQGVDLFSIADNRLAAGYEFTAGYLLGSKPKAYGVIAERATALRDDYEYVYRHYTARGIAIPHTKIAADSMRKKSSRSVLTSVRASYGHVASAKALLSPVYSDVGAMRKYGNPAAGVPVFAGAGLPVSDSAGALFVNPGESIQQAVDKAAGNSKLVLLRNGVHTLPHTLKIPSGVTLVGQGSGTILHLNPSSGERDAIVNAANDLHDVTIGDLVVEGSIKTDRGTDPNSSRSFKNEGNRGGIIFRANEDGQMKNLHFINLTVRNCTYNGVFIAGAKGIEISSCDFDENGSSVIPGPKLQHNLLLSHCADVVISNSRFDTSPFGAGISMLFCKKVKVSNSEIARNAYYGVHISESKNIDISVCLIEGNDRSGVMMEYLNWGTKNINIDNNTIWFNGGYGIESYAGISVVSKANRMEGNGREKVQQKISAEKKIIME